MTTLVKLTRDCFDAGVIAADPALALKNALADCPEVLDVKGKLHVIAAGKAAMAMMEQALQLCQPDSAMAVTNYENLKELDNCIVLGSSHPTPDIQGVKAAQAIISKIFAAEADDTVLLLLSGGASALLPAPVPEISFDSKIKVNDILVGSGLPIGKMNIVRKSLSQLKGGGFARLVNPANLYAFILSDVPDDNLADVASGPTVAAPDCMFEAVDILNSAGLWDKLPADVQNYLSTPEKRAVAPAHNMLIAGNTVSVEAMAKPIPSDFSTVFSDAPMTGDVNDAAREIADAMLNAPTDQKTVFLWGGETTVQLQGKGMGGRNQELALRVARLMKDQELDRDWAFLSGGTDGIDGPTDAAGAVVNGATLTQISEAGFDVDAELARNNSYPVLERIDALIKIGATGTNVADLQVAIVG